MTADGGCGVSLFYHYLRYCGKGKKAIILFCRGEGEGRSHVWEQIVDSYLCLELGIVWEIIISSTAAARQQVHYKVLSVR